MRRMVEGAGHKLHRPLRTPSTSLRLVPLPLRGRN